MERIYKKYLCLFLAFAFSGWFCGRFVMNLSYKLESGRQEELEVTSRNEKFELTTDPPLADFDVHSPVYLIQLARHENFVFNLLTELDSHPNGPHVHPHITEQVQSYLAKYADEMIRTQGRLPNTPAEAEASALFTAKNPILALNMVWRFADHLIIFSELFQDEKYGSTIPEIPAKQFFYHSEAISKWPDHNNVQQAIAGILTLQMVYDLDVKELSGGRIFGTETKARLQLHQCLAIGQAASAMKAYSLAIPWFELMLDKLKETRTRSVEVEEALVRSLLEKTVLKHDLEWPKKVPWDYYFYSSRLRPDNETNTSEPVPVRTLDLRAFRRLDQPYNEVNYWGLCSGENHQTEAEKARLDCWYDKNSDPALYIYPIKIELLSEEPYIVQIHDFIGDSAIRGLIESSRPGLSRSKVVNPKDISESVVSKVRTSVEGWVPGSASLPKLSKLIEVTTGLSIVPATSSERYLVARYAYSGHYECHLDGFEDGLDYPNGGNRIATMMFYLEDTELGGLTAFPQAGIAAKPIKGSAVFWYNLKRNGLRDEQTYHCACPVILGHKTIATKWIRVEDQFQRIPCGLSEDE